MTSERIVAVIPAAVLLLVIGLAARPCHAADADIKTRILNDWMLQDYGKDIRKCFTGTSGCEIESGMVAAALTETPNPKLQAELDKLTAAKVAGNDPRWRDLYIKACEGRRAARLRSLLAKTNKIVFTKHYNMGGSHYAYTEGQSDAQSERHFRPGTALCVLEMGGIYGKVTTLIEDKKGVIRDPDVSYDGKRILFSWKKSDRQDDYHLYEMLLATRKIRQLTFGLGFADYEGCYLPDGNIMFNSTRCVQIVDCWWTEVSNLYICDGSGKYMRRVGFDQVHTNYPQVLPDGRVIYTRWDYNDRGQLYPQPLFQMNIDGTGQTEYYGNNSWFPTTIAHARGIPGSDKVIAIATGHHSIQTGALIRIDVKQGRQETSGVTLVAPLVADKKDRRYRRVDGYTGFNGHYVYPYALNEKEYLASYSATQTRRDSMSGYGLYYVRQDAARELLVDDPAISCNQPVLLMKRKVPPVRPNAVDYSKTTGTYYVQDVYFGPGLKDIAPGTVKKLRVVALDYRAAGVGSNGNGGPAGGALVSTPVAIRNGSWDVKIVLGETDVYEDGSAFFEVPARTPLYFQMIDANGYVVQSMRSWSTLMPGEKFSCLGCHEDKNAASLPRKTTRAMAAGPRKLKPFYGPPRGFSFPKMIQPIFDKHCIRCHNDRSKSRKIAAKGASKPSKVNLKGARAILARQSPWKYTTRNPGKNWRKGDFNDSQWTPGSGGFGTSGTPGGKVCTNWKTPDIWLRTTFNLPPNANTAALSLLVCHDEDVEIHVNGVPAASATGFITGYTLMPLSAAARKALRPGKNSIAVHCRQTGGGQYIDVGLYDMKPGAPPPPKPKVVAAKPAAKPREKKAFSLLSTVGGASGGRKWSDSYLALTRNGRPNQIVNWLNAQSIPPMLPPYFTGSAKSDLMTMLRKGHNGVKLSREEMDKIACWIDLLVPYCGDYLEANAWSEKALGKYMRYLNKRKRMEAVERKNIQALMRKRAR